MDGKTFWNV